MVEPYRPPPRSSEGNAWVFAGLASSFPNIDPSPKSIPSGSLGCSTTGKLNLSETIESLPAGSVLQITPSASQVLTPAEALGSVGLKEQVLIFQYRGKFHAFDHQCPHQSFPLSRGSLHDIEDFGIVLSGGIRCPKHGWEFDLFTGKSDRAAYQLKMWEVELRDTSGLEADQNDKTVWVRKKVPKREG